MERTMAVFLGLYLGIAFIFGLSMRLWIGLDGEEIDGVGWVKLVCLALIWPVVIGLSMVGLAIGWNLTNEDGE